MLQPPFSKKPVSRRSPKVTDMSRKFILLTGIAWACLNGPAFADDAAILQRLDAMQKKLDAQQHEIAAQRAKIESQSKELSKLRHSLAAAPVAPESTATASAAPAPASVPVVASQQGQIDALKTELADYKAAQSEKEKSTPVVSYIDGHPLIKSADGRFTFGVRALAQVDMAYYDQSDSASRLASANGPALGSGTNFRRAFLGVKGKLFGDWSYLFNYNFGGANGNESQGRVQSVYLQYDGFKPFALRVGAYPPPASLEDGTSATNTIFMERNAPTDAARSIAGADGRDAISLIYAAPRFFGALSYTGGKVADKTSFSGEQNALMSRVADIVYADDDWKFLVGANGTYVMNPPYDTTGGTHTIGLKSMPELTVDNTGTSLVNTGALNANHVTQWGLETAAQWRSLYGQAGYYKYAIDRVGAVEDPDFDGWYLQGSWVLTGERRGYSVANGAFTAPKPAAPFDPATGGFGAWEVALRYSDLDLNYDEGMAGFAAPADAVRGGHQKIWTFGLNWYPNELLRFALNLEHIEVDRLGTTASPVVANADVGQSLNAVAFRTQFGF
jgi:phosphate-selective porin OprO/OprP